MSMRDEVPVETLHAALQQHRRQRTAQLERDNPFSWRRLVVSLLSYSLLLSDAFRSGFAVTNLSAFAAVEPSVIVEFGPYAYPGIHLTLANATRETLHPSWLYKFDTTSITMRSVVQTLQVESWPSCLLYREERGTCSTRDGIPLRTIFEMLDDVVSRVRTHTPPVAANANANAAASSSLSGFLQLRSEHMWVDRLNHFVLPWIFRHTIRRTSQALYFDSRHLASRFFPHCGRHTRRPLTCEAQWIRFDRVCRHDNSYCQSVTDVWRHVARRLQFLQAAYPNRSLDLVVFEGMDDYTRGGFVFHGRKDQDLVAVTRLRDCSSGTCNTVAIDDFRYESAAHTTSVVDWFVIIGSLRLLGQMYVWLRLTMLVIGIFHARSTEDRFRQATLRTRCLLTARTFFLIPSQAVIYGSVFPIACYAVAHALDSSYVYEMIAQHFRTPLGVYRFNLREVVNVSAVALRSVWVMASVCHVLLTANTHRLWSPVHGVVCVPAFFVTLLASPSVFAQVRSTSWRNTNVLHAYEVVPGLVRAHPQRFTTDNSRRVANAILLGTTIDVQFLLSAWLLLCVAGAVWALAGRILRSVSSFARVSAIGAMPSRYSSAKRVTSVRLMTQLRGGSVNEHQMHALDCRSQELESLLYLVNVAVMTEPLTFLRCRLLRTGVCIGVFRLRRSQRVVLLPWSLVGNTSMDVPIEWSELDLCGVVNSRDLPWSDLLHCG